MFISEEEFKRKISSDEFVEWEKYDTAFGTWYYGTLMEDYCDYPDDLVVILTPEGLKKASSAVAADFKSFFIYVEKDELRSRAINRGDNPEEVDRRMKSDEKMFRGFRADHIMYGKPKEVARKIKRIAYE